jgi:Big-like domain-containing protein
VLATALITGSFVGLSATVASAATTPVTLALTSGTFAPQGNTPKALPAATTPALVGAENTRTGTIKPATLTIPPQPQSNTGTKETIKIYEHSAHSAVASLTPAGDLSITDTVMIEVDITLPLVQDCITSSPVHLLLQSTAPYNGTTQSVDVADRTFSIPSFTSVSGTSCGLAEGTLTERFSGAVGNVLTLDLHGALVVPPPGTTTTTTLTATPPAPVLAGTTTVTLSAKISGSGATSPTTGPTGTMKFFNGSALVGTQGVTGTTTTYVYKAATLPAGTNRLTAVYSGGNGFNGSTSAALTYAVTAVPSVTVSTPQPSTTIGGSGSFSTFTMTVTNPASSETWPDLFLRVGLTGIRGLTAHTMTLQYKDASGTWCSLVTFNGREEMIGIFLGLRSTCTTPSFPASFAMTKGSSLVIPFRIAFPTSGYYGVQKVTATLDTGTCNTITTTTVILVHCTATAPLTGSVSPSGTASITVLPSAPIASQTSDFATRKATSPVRSTFEVGLQSSVGPATPGPGLPIPTGTVNYKLDGVTVATGVFQSPATGANRTGRNPYSTTGLALGRHTLVSTYSGDAFYASSSLSETFTVLPAPSGTAFSCTNGGFDGPVTVPAYVTATGTVPRSTPLATSTTEVSATTVSVTLDIDPVLGNPYNSNQSAAALTFSPNGTGATAGPITFDNPTGTTPDIIGTWTGITTQVPVAKGTAPGTQITVSATGILFHSQIEDAADWTCTPVTAGAPVASVPVAGTTLSVSPNSPQTAGTALTLTATVYPAPVAGGSSQAVRFFDGTTSLGTGQLAASGTGAVASLTVSNLAAGSHTLKAVWSGTPTAGVGANTSNSVSFVVNPPPPPPPPAPPAPPTPPAPPATSSGYHLVASNGSVYSYGTAPFYGSMGGQTLNKPIVGTATTPGDGGYWLVASDGGIFSFGNAAFYGSMGGQPLNQPIVGIASTPDGKGYWEVASDGGIFAFGDATFYGSMGGKPLNKPIVGIAATPDGKGYWEVASDGGIFAFGDAAFSGSTGSLTLNKPIVGMASTVTGGGYWLVAADGGVFAFGNAGFHGTVAGTSSASIVSLVPTADNGGYWETASNGQVFQFGDATSAGTALAQTATIVAMSD